MEQHHLGFFRRYIQTPLQGLFASTSQGEMHSEALLRHTMREARKKVAWETPLRDVRFVVIDTETTGFQPGDDALLSVGAVEVLGSTIQERTLHSLVRPDPMQSIPQAVVELTGIRDEDVQNAPPLRDVMLLFLQFVHDAVLVAHHAGHDLRFLNAGLKKTYKAHLPHRVLDTVDVARWLHPDLPSYALDDLLTLYNIPVRGRHTADGDAQMTAELWHCLIEQALAREVSTLGEFIEQVVLSKRA
ncbi:exonuclease domain-containing protein [Tumebacillus permanentifrigoris]|uniref:DNA polymerase-3 subunit epsilon n=1 Tax=Tumebacillus permanentifrigoris TaxID=378543 RepID=A0A316D9C5_9BACL|nr:exonuclease domain-containing protein [Tumebacillus permanentifrigoris]PWK13360.1 DNA polymerase-3 subunit epsilon [Tumebacillus permanentifrigoris]